MDKTTVKLRGIYAEELINIVFKGKIIRTKGYDLVTSNGCRIEVKSRKMFTDGRIPRVTLNKSKMRYSNAIGVVQYNNDLEESIAIGIVIPTKSLIPLYNQYRQKNDVAHIPLHKIMCHPRTVDIKHRLIVAENHLESKIW